MYRNFPTDMPDISMTQLSEEELEDLRDVSLADHNRGTPQTED